MRKPRRKCFCSRIAALGLSVALMLTVLPTAGAVTQSDIDEMRSQQSSLQDQIGSVQSQIDDLAQQQDTALEQSLLYQEQMGLLAEQISSTTEEISDYQAMIAQTQDELEEAQSTADEYYQLFCERVRNMEETGRVSYWAILFNASSFSDLLDRVNFIRQVTLYDNSVVDTLENARQDVADYEVELEEEEVALEGALADLEQQEAEIAAASEQNDLLLIEIENNQEIYADQLAELERESDALAENIVVSEAEYQAQLEELARQAAEEEARRQAEEEAARKQAEEEAARKQAEEEAARKQAEEETARKQAEAARTQTVSAASGGESSSVSAGSSSSSSESTGGSSGSTASSSGSAMGVAVADYACQFIGNPYVYGGTSLTNGCDCSGFVMQVYAHFGVSLPHSSHAQAVAGVGVSYADAQPGDIIYYNSSGSPSGGHVGIYIGNGRMVSALGSAYGICISTVNPNSSGFTVRRIFT